MWMFNFFVLDLFFRFVLDFEVVYVIRWSFFKFCDFIRNNLYFWVKVLVKVLYFVIVIYFKERKFFFYLIYYYVFRGEYFFF